MGNHVAYNITTHEYLTTNCANRLKRWVAQSNDYNYRNEYDVGVWFFAHGVGCRLKLETKINHYTGRSH